MKIYVAGPLADTKNVQAVQSAVVAAGHELTQDWSRGPDIGIEDDYGSLPAVSAKLATEDLDAVLTADAVLVIASEHDGHGMFVELGAALARARHGDLEHVVVIGPIRHESVFFYHPAIGPESVCDSCAPRSAPLVVNEDRYRSGPEIVGNLTLTDRRSHADALA